MSVSKLPSGRWRAQVYDPATSRNVSAAKVLGHAEGSYPTKREAKAAREKARERLAAPRSSVTVAEFARRWSTDPLFARPKESTRLHNAERVRAFVERHGALRLADIDDDVVSAWLAGGRRSGTVPALRAMWNDAASAKAGRLVQRNPWAGLGIARSVGNRNRQPPDEETVWRLIAAARALSGPGFAAWLQVACFSGARPGELDALRWDAVDLAAARLRIAEQFSAATRTFTAPKNGRPRWAPLTPPAREALLSLPRDGAFCFRPLRGEHFTPSARAYHWKAVRAAAGYDGTLYLATRHFAGWYMVNVLELPSEDVAIALGHTDGGELVRRLYGHRDVERALERVRRAYESTGNVKPLRAVGEETA
jgi:integrase